MSVLLVLIAAGRSHRCFGSRRLGNVLDKLPKRLQPQGKRLLQEIFLAATKKDAVKAVEGFAQEFGGKYPKAVECLVNDEDELLTYFYYPAEHWVHLRTTNPIESTFSTVRLRSRVMRGVGSRTAGLAMTFKLLQAASGHWRKLNGNQLLPLVRAGVKFIDGKQQERKLKLINNQPEKKPVKRSAA